MNQEELTLTPDTFLRVLGVPNVEQVLGSAAHRKALFDLAMDFLREEAEVTRIWSYPDLPPGTLGMLVPRTAFHVRLTGPVQDEVKQILAVGAYILGTGRLDGQALTLVGVTALLTRLRKLNADYGERSIVDALGKVTEKSAQRVTLQLNGKPCCYPQSSCRYRQSDGNCVISPEQTQEVLNDLVDRGILRKLTSAEPVEYAVVF